MPTSVREQVRFGHLADGRVIRTGGRSRKSAAGYDLTRLMVGSEGTLGIITEVQLRLYGIPEAISSAVCSFESLDGAIDTVMLTIQSGIPVARIELLDDGAAASAAHRVRGEVRVHARAVPVAGDGLVAELVPRRRVVLVVPGY